MKTLLIAIGKTDNKYLTAATDDYLGRANHYAPIEMKVIPDIRDVKNLSQEQQKVREGELILKQLQPGDHVILLDEGGKDIGRTKTAGCIMAAKFFYVYHVFLKSTL